MMRPVSTRLATRLAASRTATAVPRRWGSTAGETIREGAQKANTGSDTPWAIGALLVWVPCLVYLTAPQDTKDKIKHTVPHPAARNFGMSRQPRDEPEDEPAVAPEEEEHAPIQDSDEPAGQESSTHVEVDQKKDRPWQGSETFKTPRESHPGVNHTLEEMAEDRDGDNVSRQKNSTDKGPATLQPDDGKLHHAAKLAQDGDHHDPKKGQAKREQEKSESGGKKPMSEQEIMNAQHSEKEAEVDPKDK